MALTLNVVRMLNKGRVMRNIGDVRGGRSGGSHTKSMNVTNVTKTKMQRCRIKIMFVASLGSNGNGKFRRRR